MYFKKSFFFRDSGIVLELSLLRSDNMNCTQSIGYIMEIKLITRDKIDKVKWDSCVHFANNGHLFGYTWYLDNVAKDWDGLVEGDYESVFPLIHKEMSFGVKALHMPDLLGKSGIYSIHILSKIRLGNFIAAIPSEYKIRDIRFNEAVGPSSLSGISNTEHTEYHLLLKNNWEGIAKNYSKELLDVLQDKIFQKFMADSSISPEVLTDFYMENHPNAKEENKHTYLRIIYNLMHRGTGFISGMRNEKGDLIAANYFAFSHGRMISLIPVWKGEIGKKSLWKLTDMLIQSNSGKPMKFDFNISMAGDFGADHFGAEKVIYRGLHENNLKGIKKWFNR